MGKKRPRAKKPTTKTQKKPRSPDWTRDQQLMALRLYLRTPFGRLHKGNPEIIALNSSQPRGERYAAML